MNRKNISVLGGGSWGTVLAYLASLNGNQVNLWMRDNNLAQEINKTSINKRYLPNLELGKNITATSGVWNARDIAVKILRGVRKKSFVITPGLEMTLLDKFHSLLAPIIQWYMDLIVLKTIKKGLSATRKSEVSNH